MVDLAYIKPVEKTSQQIIHSAAIIA